MKRLTAPALFAISHGEDCRGEHHCFYCGAPATSKYKQSAGFTDWNNVVGGSDYRCRGCEISQDERRPMSGYEKPQKTRSFSWLVTRHQSQAFTKSHIPALREICLNPPVGSEWALCLATSGQKPLLYKTPVNCPNDKIVTVRMEDQLVSYAPQQLSQLLTVAADLAIVIGKLSLQEPLSFQRYRLLTDAGVSDVSWWDFYQQPLYQLAAFLAPSKKELTT